MTIQHANLDTDADKRSFDHGQLSVVTLADTALARAVFNPGFKWSNDVGPQAKTPSCQVRHAGVVLAGRFRIRMDDGAEVELGPGDAHVVEPGHDAWVVGDEQCVIIDVGPAPAAGDGAPESVVRSYFEAFNRGDVDTIVGLFTDDATVMAESTPTAGTPAQLRATYEGFFSGFTVTEDVTVDRVEVAHDLAVVSTRSTGSMSALGGGGESRPLRLRELFGLRRTPAGWRISQYVFNSEPVS